MQFLNNQVLLTKCTFDFFLSLSFVLSFHFCIEKSKMPQDGHVFLTPILAASAAGAIVMTVFEILNSAPLVRGGVMLSWLLWLSSSQACEITEANGTNFLTLRGEHIWVISSPSLSIGNKLTNKQSVINAHQCVCDICIVCSTLQTDAQVIKCGVLR